MDEYKWEIIYVKHIINMCMEHHGGVMNEIKYTKSISFRMSDVSSISAHHVLLWCIMTRHAFHYWVS